MFSCNDGQDIKRIDLNYELSFIGELKLPLDSLTTSMPHAKSNSFQTNNPNDPIFEYGKSYFQMMSFPNILIYDVAERKLLLKVPIKRDELNMVGMPGTARVINSDSIYFINYPNLSLIDFKGNLLKNYSLMTKEKIAEIIPIHSSKVIGKSFISAFATNSIPPRDGNKKYTNADLLGALLNLDLESGHLSFLGAYPSEYAATNFIPRHYYFQSISESPNPYELVASFGASDSVQVFHTERDIVKTYFAGFSEFIKVPPKQSPTVDDFDFYRLNFSYNELLYDPYRELLYRVVELPKPESSLSNPDRSIANYKQLAIITLDKNFQKISETVLPKNFHNEIIFVSEEGLNIWDFEKSFQDEDHLYLGVFQLNEKIAK